MYRLALFASGSGTNVQNICEYFQSHNYIIPVIIFSDREDSFVLERAKNLNIKSECFNYITTTPEKLLKRLNNHQITCLLYTSPSPRDSV